MNAFKPLALLITGGMATQSGAVVQTFNVLPSTEGTPITIGGSATAQYSYSAIKAGDGFPVTLYNFNTEGSTSYLAPLSSASQLPNSHSEFYQGSYKVDATNDDYVGLKFNIGNDVYYGTARFSAPIFARSSDTAGFLNEEVLGPQLTEVEYNLAGGVPEPESWALLIAGMGVAGAAMRRSRRRATAVTA